MKHTRTLRVPTPCGRPASVLALLASLMVSSSAASAATIYVDRNAPGPVHDGASPETAYLTISAGLSQTGSGDTVSVASGTYTEAYAVPAGVHLLGASETSVFVRPIVETSPLTLNANATLEHVCVQGGIISCPGYAEVRHCILQGNPAVRVGACASPIIEDNTIAGTGRGFGIECRGGSSATIQRNSISNTSCGVLAAMPSAPRVLNNTIEGNDIGFEGGGTGTLIQDNRIRFNAGTAIWFELLGGTARANVLEGNGQSVTVRGDPSYSNVACSALLEGNQCDGNNGPAVMISYSIVTMRNNRITHSCGAAGVGIYVESSTIEVAANVVTDNEGGGITCVDSTGRIVNNFVSRNTADSGAGISALRSAVTIANNSFTFNQATGDGATLSCLQSPNAVIVNNLLVNNTGAGIATGPYPYPAIRNNNVYANTGPPYTGIYDRTGTYGNVSVDPQFRSDPGPPLSGCHLSPASLCHDWGDDSVVLPGDTDYDGEPRIQGTHVDIGADESPSTANHPPTVSGGIYCDSGPMPLGITTNMVFYAWVTGVDPENDPVTLTCVWKRNAEVMKTATGIGGLMDVYDLGMPGYGDRGDYVYLTVTPNDGKVDGALLSTFIGPIIDAPPVARDDSASAFQGVIVYIDVGANDTDPDGDAFRVGSVSPPSHGVVDYAGPMISYRSDPSFTGTDSLQYTLVSIPPGMPSWPATVTITVQPGPSIDDVLHALRIAGGLAPAMPVNTPMLDMFFDGSVNLRDAIRLARKVLSLDPR